MKNIFKFMGVALLASSMIFVGCNKDEEDNGGNNNNNGNNNGNTEVKYYTVTVSANDNAMGTVTITPAKEKYQKGDTITLTATPADSYIFLNWNDNNNENPRKVVVTKDANYMANFSEDTAASFKIYWTPLADAATPLLQEIGYVDSWRYSNTVHAFTAARGINGNQPVFPYFVINFDLDEDPQYGCALAAAYTYGTSYPGDIYFPTYVFDSCFVEETEGDQRGDYELISATSPDYVSLETYAFDGNAHVYSGDLIAYMYNRYDYVTYIASLGLGEGIDPTDEQITAAFQQCRFKVLQVELRNWFFELSSSRKNVAVK